MRRVIYRSVFFALLILLCVGREVIACGPANFSSATISFPGTINVSKNDPIGKVLVESATATISGTIGGPCSGTWDLTPWPMNTTLTPSSYPHTVNTNIPGIGLQVQNTYYISNPKPSWNDGYFSPTNRYPVYQMVNLKSNETLKIDLTWVGRLVVTGPVSTRDGNTITNIGGLLFNLTFGQGTAFYMTNGNMSISTKATKVILESCEIGTSAIEVPMGTHAIGQLSAPGDTTDRVGFSIALRGCADTVKDITYQLAPATSVLDDSLSVIALDSTSSAKGVGLQLLDNAGKALPLSKDQPFNFIPNPAGDYDIPLQARYYRLNQAISGGTANTSVTFSVTYQ
ncbi:fimbrial protein [Klebsiella aerogenes]|nr:fimbrial protein [Klebsiella aerogenes]